MMMQCFLTTPVLQSIKENSLFKMLRTFLFKKKGDISYKVALRHERDQSFLVPVPVPAKKNFGPGPFRKKFWCRSQSKIFGSRFRSKKTFWSRSCSENFFMLVLVKKNFGPGPGQKQIWSQSRDHFAHL